MAMTAAEREAQRKEKLQTKMSQISAPSKGPSASGLTGLANKKNDKEIAKLQSTMRMPISGDEVSFELKLLPLDRVVVNQAINPRIQSLLSRHVPEIEELIESIQSSGQRDPILVRHIETRKDKELIYGSRRLFGLKEVAKDNPKGIIDHPNYLEGAWRVLALVPADTMNISNSDACKLADDENDQRDDLSAWEKAMRLSPRYHEALEMAGSQNKACEMLGVNSKSFKRVLNLSWIPVEVLKALETPSGLTTADDVLVGKIRIYFDHNSDELLNRSKEAFSNGLRFKNFKTLVSKLLPELKKEVSKDILHEYKGKTKDAPSAQVRFNGSVAKIFISKLSEDHKQKLDTFLKELTLSKTS